MQKEINEAIKIARNNTEEKFSKYNKIYLFTTENLCYIKNFQNVNKAVCVGASGDHILNLVYFGCNNITAFDINKLSYYILKLKIAAVETFSYKEFMYFFISGNFDYNLYLKIKLEKDIKYFWDSLYKEFSYNGKDLYNSFLFIKNNEHFYIRNNPYLSNNDSYIKLKANIKGLNINFINKNILEINNLKGFNIILLSNISDYIDNMFNGNSIDCLKQYDNLINKLLETNNCICMAYIYDFSYKKTYRNAINNEELIKEYIKDYKIYKFNGAYNINLTDAIIVKGEY